MVTGFDVGTRGFRVARGEPGSSTVSETSPLYLRVSDDDFEDTDLSRSALSTVRVDGETYVVGPDATRAAAAVGGEPERLLDHGVLSDRDCAAEVFAAIASEFLGPPGDGGAGGGSGHDDARLAYSVPGSVVDASLPTRAHRETVATVLDDLGYEPTPVASGFAVVYDALAGENLTGVGVAVGAASTAVALVYYGVPVLAFSVAKGGEWVAEQAAAATGEPVDQIVSVQSRTTIESGGGDGVEGALARGYDALVGDVVAATVSEATEGDVREGVSVPVVVGGEGAVPGLAVLAAGRFDECDLDLRVTDARLVDEPAVSVARGALAAAADDVDAFADVTWGATGGFSGGGDIDPESAGADGPTLVGRERVEGFQRTTMAAVLSLTPVPFDRSPPETPDTATP